jgi:hypothetical protein
VSAVRWKAADLQPDQHLLLREADPPATQPEPQAGDPDGDRPQAGVRGRPGSAKGRGSRFRLKAPEPKENDVLTSVLQALLYHPQVADAYRMNTGAGKLLFADGTSSRFIRFGKKGSPDIHGYLVDGRALFVETKRPSGRKRKEQIEWIERARRHGCAAFFARRIEDVKEQLG